MSKFSIGHSPAACSPSEGAGLPGPRALLYCERGTCGCRRRGPACSPAVAACRATPPALPERCAPASCCGRRAGVLDDGIAACRSRPARIRTAPGWWRRNVAARIAVVRVETFAVPRLDRNPPVEPIPRPPPSDFLQQHDADHGGDHHEMNHDNDGLHRLSFHRKNRARRSPASV